MAKLMIHRNILKEYRKLPSKVQKRIPELIFEFQADPHSDAIGMHPLTETMLDPKVRGITKLPDGYRAIIIAPEQGDTYLLVHVDSHDRAYQWAKNKRFEVHGATGVFQVFNPDEIESAISQTSPGEDSKKDRYPLQKLSVDDLFAAGVPKPLIPAVQNITDDAQLDALIEA
jgi:mRNA-degrading endonuclease RelE of RelBE toxin-antitoxin system